MPNKMQTNYHQINGNIVFLSFLRGAFNARAPSILNLVVLCSRFVYLFTTFDINERCLTAAQRNWIEYRVLPSRRRHRYFELSSMNDYSVSFIIMNYYRNIIYIIKWSLFLRKLLYCTVYGVRMLRWKPTCAAHNVSWLTKRSNIINNSHWIITFFLVRVDLTLRAVVRLHTEWNRKRCRTPSTVKIGKPQFSNAMENLIGSLRI